MGGYYLTVLTSIGIQAMAVMGLNVIVGFAGQISLGHAAFFGIGAYTAAVASTRYGLSPLLALALAVLVAALVGFFLGFPSLRVKHDFLAITTIGTNFIAESLFLYLPFFGGALGIGGIPRFSALGLTFGGGQLLWLVWGSVLAVAVLCHLFRRTWAGLALECVREEEVAASSVGVSLVRFKLMAFVLGSAVAGLAGGYYAFFMRFISPSDFSFPVSVMFLSMLVVGGIGTISGPLVGALLLGILPEVFRPLVDYRMLLYGATLLLTIRFQPKGLLGEGGLVERLLSRGGGVGSSRG